MTTTELRDLAQSITATRKRARLTQRQVASLMGTDQGNIARLESGRHQPSVRILQQFARATNTSLRFVFEPVPSRPQPEKVNPTMLTMSPTSRRALLGGSATLAALFAATGRNRQVSAQDATAAASAVSDYAWTPPAYDPEQPLFTVLERTAETIRVETAVDGVIEVPANPQRVVTTNLDYIPLYELGIAEVLVGVGLNGYEDVLERAGALTNEMHAALADVARITEPWELDIEQVLALQPDLVLGDTVEQNDDVYNGISSLVPFIRRPRRVTDVPRAAVRDLGALFDRADVADELIAEHETFVARAREAIAPFAKGKKFLVMYYMPDTAQVAIIPSYYDFDGSINTLAYAYPFHRELLLTPTSFGEKLADADDRNSYTYDIAVEQIDLVDADHIFVRFGGDEFLDLPIVHQTTAGKAGNIHIFDEVASNYGLAGTRDQIAWIVETVTGEPFA